MSVFKDIQLALDTELKRIPLGLDIAWENVAYEPKAGRPWIRPTVLNGRSDFLNLDNMQENPGIYQVDVFFPANKGTGNLLDAVDAIFNHFNALNSVIHGVNKIEVGSVRKKSSMNEDAWFTASVEIVFNCYST